MVGFNKYTLDEKKQRELAQIGSAQVFRIFSGAFHKNSLIATIVHELFQKPGNNPALHFTQGHNGNHNHLYQSSPPLPSSSSFFSSSSSPFPYPSFFICICVNICARVCMWRKEVLIMCSYQWLYFFFLRQCLSLNTELTDFTRLAVHHVPRIPLSPHSTLHSQHWGDRSLPQPYMIFFWRVAAKDRTRVLMFASQVFYWLRFASSLKDPNFLTITVPIIKQWKAWPFLAVTLTLWWSYGTRPTKALMTHSSATQTTRCQRSSLFPRASC